MELNNYQKYQKKRFISLYISEAMKEELEFIKTTSEVDLTTGEIVRHALTALCVGRFPIERIRK